MKSIQDLTICYLDEYPDALPELVQLFIQEWDYYGENGPGNAYHYLTDCVSRDSLPVGQVAIYQNRLYGFAALNQESIHTHPHLYPWLASLLVVPKFRHNGVGKRLVTAVEDLAKTLGYCTLYAGTEQKTSPLYQKGWEEVETIGYEGAVITILKKLVSPQS